jgi:hypothetical protein
MINRVTTGLYRGRSAEGTRPGVRYRGRFYPVPYFGPVGFWLGEHLSFVTDPSPWTVVYPPTAIGSGLLPWEPWLAAKIAELRLDWLRSQWGDAAPTWSIQVGPVVSGGHIAGTVDGVHVEGPVPCTVCNATDTICSHTRIGQVVS